MGEGSADRATSWQRRLQLTELLQMLSREDGKGFSPFGGAKPAAASFSGNVGGTEIGFTLEASDLSELVKGMSGGGTIRLSGSIDSVSFN